MKLECDVLVVGGGAAGLASAISAARSGAGVVLAERSTLGGNASAALVHTFCGLYEMDRASPISANPGLATEWANLMIDAGVAGPPVRMGRLWVLPHDPHQLPEFARRCLEAEENIRLWKVDSLLAVHVVENKIVTVVFSTREGELIVAPKAAVDATGDAHLAALAGCAADSAPADRLQRPAFIAGIDGFPAAWLEPSGRLQLAGSIAAAVADKKLPTAALGATFRSGRKSGSAWCTIDLPGDPAGNPFAPSDEGCRQRLTEFGRATMESLCRHLQSTIREPLVVSKWPECIGIRESRRVVGRQLLTGDDLRRGSRFPNAIAKVSWPMELRERATGLRLIFPDAGQPAEIPEGALQAADVRNLLSAGRCISADHEAQAAIRVLGMCLATGEAAGRAAAKIAIAA